MSLSSGSSSSSGCKHKHRTERDTLFVNPGTPAFRLFAVQTLGPPNARKVLHHCAHVPLLTHILITNFCGNGRPGYSLLSFPLWPCLEHHWKTNKNQEENIPECTKRLALPHLTLFGWGGLSYGPQNHTGRLAEAWQKNVFIENNITEWI